MVYISGRDKFFRPLVFVNASKVEASKSKMTNDQIISIGIIIFEFLERYMYVNGQIENMILIIDTLNIGIFKAPYAMLKALMTTI